MLPKVVLFNSVSIDCAIKDFNVNVSLHYEVLARMNVDVLLGGSDTAKTGIDLFVKNVPPEEPSDFQKTPPPPDDDARPLWVIPDSRGILKGLLHVHRKSGYAKGIIILVSSITPKTYLDYLKERHYDYIVVGDNHVGLRKALEELNRLYGVKTVVTDTGGILAGCLLDERLVDEVQLLVAPEIVGKNAINLFRTTQLSVKLELMGSENLKGGNVLLKYKVKH